MKHFVIFIISVFMCLNTYGQNTYTGKLIGVGNPCQTIPCLPGGVMALETASGNYVLTINSYWIWSDKIIFNGIEYFIDDEVEITGITTTKQDINANEYIELEIETIKKKLASNIESLSFRNNKVYYDEIRQVIVVDETLQNQFLTFELVNMQGKVILRKTGISNNNFISIANLSGGVYLYRLIQNSQVICIGKILKIK
jgi:hypothetical protein